MKAAGGVTCIFKTHFYPPGFRSLVAEIWNKLRLPVKIWLELPEKVLNQLKVGPGMAYEDSLPYILVVRYQDSDGDGTYSLDEVDILYETAGG